VVFSDEVRPAIHVLSFDHNESLPGEGNDFAEAHSGNKPSTIKGRPKGRPF